MKDRELKDALKAYAGTPDPFRKDAFIRSVAEKEKRKRATIPAQIFVQARYIRVYAWLTAVVIVLLPLFEASVKFAPLFKVAADVMPFLAGLGVIEAMRAEAHNMAELEQATLLSAKSAFFARMILIGAAQFAAILAAAALFSKGEAGSMLTAGINLILPHCVTNILCFVLERTKFGRENVWSCFAVAAGVFLLKLIVETTAASFTPDNSLLLLLTAVLIVIEIVEFKKTVNTEELSWN